MIKCASSFWLKECMHGLKQGNKSFKLRKYCGIHLDIHISIEAEVRLVCKILTATFPQHSLSHKQIYISFKVKEESMPSANGNYFNTLLYR